MNDLAATIQHLLNIQGLSASDLSQKTGIDKSLISRLLSNKTTNPQIETLNKIADCFDVTIDQLIGKMPLASGSTHGNVVHVKRFIAPVIPWEAAAVWKSIKGNYQADEKVDVNADVSQDTFALKIFNDSFEPRFSADTILIVDPNQEPRTFDIVLACNSFNTPPLLYEYHKKGEQFTLKAFFLENSSVMYLPKQTPEILGVLVEAVYSRPL